MLKALFFDVFGTLVDWRCGVSREAEAVLRPLGYSLDWFAFADAWRARYQPAMEEIRSGRLAYMKLDAVHRRMLTSILDRFGLERLEPQTVERLTLVWHHLDAWPDAAVGLSRLRRRFKIAPLSNGNIAIMTDLARRNDFCLVTKICGRASARVICQVHEATRFPGFPET
jgi:2-haloacid dehalogenase